MNDRGRMDRNMFCFKAPDQRLISDCSQTPWWRLVSDVKRP